MNELESLLARMNGLDANNEVVNLWYEVTYLRFLIKKIADSNQVVGDILNNTCYDDIRKEAQEYVTNKFPKLGIKFNNPQSNLCPLSEDPACTPPTPE